MGSRSVPVRAGVPLGLASPASTWEFPNLAALWAVIRDRIRTGGVPELDGIHGAPGLAWVEGDQPAVARDGNGNALPASVQWGRTIVVPVVELGARTYEPPTPFDVRFNIREEQGEIVGAPMPRVPLLLAHRWLYRLLDGWVPTVAGLYVGPLVLFAASGDALYDADQRLYYQTATWRTDVTVA